MSSGGGGGSSQPTSTTVTNTTIPEYARPYVEGMLGQGQALTDINQNPYTQYQGQQVAGTSPLQQQGWNGISGQQTSQGTQQAQGLAALNWQNAGRAGSALDGFNPMNVQAGRMGDPSQVTTEDYTGANVDKYMSPYMQDVVEQQKQGAIRDYSRSIPGLGSAAASVGGLGGTRNALMMAEGNRNLQDQLAGIQASGSQAGFQNAQQQFNAQQQANLQAQQANQGAGLATGQANLGSYMQAQTANQGAGLQAAGMRSSLGLQGVQQQLAASGQLGALGNDLFGQQMSINDALTKAGTQQRGQTQEGLSSAYQDFLNQQNYPYKQLGFMSDLIRGTGATTQAGSTVYTQPPNQLGQVAGLGLGLGSLFGK